MIDLPNTAAEAHAELYAAMRRGSDPRWGQPLVVAAHSPRSYRWIWGVVGFGAVVIAGLVLA